MTERRAAMRARGGRRDVTDAPEGIPSVSVALMRDGKMLLETRFFVKTSPTEVTFQNDEKATWLA
jgi:hypothetical protein